MALADLFNKELEKRFDFVDRQNGSSKAFTEATLAELYAIYGKPAPVVVWCQSLYQIATLPSILVSMFYSDAWQIASGALIDRVPDEQWDEDFEIAWEELWAHGGQQTLKGMKKTSRVGSLYWHLESALFLQCKKEMSTWLKSGARIRSFEETLPKETIYRRFWAMDMSIWHLNAVQDRLRMFSAGLPGLLAGEIQLFESQWNQFLPYQERLLRVFRGAETSLHSLLTGMGAEPGNQLRHCNWLPMVMPMIALSQIWMQLVNKESFKNVEREIAAWNRLSQSTLGVLCMDNVVFACEKPEVFSVDEGGRLHNPDGAAIKFSDGFSAYSWHGVIVEPRIIEEPDSIHIDEIESTLNAEMRRVLIERYGQVRYLQDSNAEEIQQDEYGILYRKEILGDEPLVMVKVINSSPEPDGTYKDYFLRVPPTVLTAKEAVAWTFGFEADEYLPQIET